MSSEAHLRLALRRSGPLVLVCVLIGVAALLALTELSGAQYRASTRVVVTDPNLRSLLSGTSVPNVETQAQGEIAAVLASSPGFFQYAAHSQYPQDWKRIQREVEVTQLATSSVISFTVTATSASRAVSLSDALAEDFPRYEVMLETAPLRQALSAAQRRAAVEPHSYSARASIKRLRLLETASTGGVPIGSAGPAEQIRPAPIRSALEGATVGLVIGLLLMGLREALAGAPSGVAESEPR
jgi:capsular polysaccharide biosynthesis protein